MPGLNKLVRLSPANWSALFSAYRYLLSAGWILFVRRENLDRWLMTNTRIGSDHPLTSESRSVRSRQVYWVNAVAQRPLPWARCLQRSLALCLWMEKHDFQFQLKIGVRKEGDTLLAHAWVESGGEVINDNPQFIGTFMTLGGVGKSWSRDPRIGGGRWT